MSPNVVAVTFYSTQRRKGRGFCGVFFASFATLRDASELVFMSDNERSPPSSIFLSHIFLSPSYCSVVIFLSMESICLPPTIAKSRRSTPLLRGIRGLARSRSGCRAPLACPRHLL